MRIYTYADAPGGPTRVGDLYAEVRRGRLTSTFAYDTAYLAEPGSLSLEPGMPLQAGAWPHDGLPASFRDAAPDRWGRNLIRRRLDAHARYGGSAPRQLSDADFLLGVSDVTRQGNLRFATAADGPFEHPGSEVPKLLELPRLLSAAHAVARDDRNLEAVKELLDAGTASLGGARPKAAVREGDRLHLAKFSHPADEWDVIGWESAALDLAALAGIQVPPHRRVPVGGQSVLLLERFDRDGAKRHGYISAMTLLGAREGDQRDYVEIAEALEAVSGSPAADLAELFRRIAFSLALNNTDDHLRNHGFVRRRDTWRLSPAFDINPVPFTGGHATGIGGSVDRDEGAAALLAYASSFGLSAHEARAVAGQVAEACSRWREIALRNGVDATELARFSPVLSSGIELLRSL